MKARPKDDAPTAAADVAELAKQLPVASTAVYARPTAVVYGSLAANLTVPQVAAAIHVLKQASKPLAAFQGHRRVANGAFLDPRRDSRPSSSGVPERKGLGPRQACSGA